MKRNVVIHLVTAVWMCTTASSAHAHHSHPYFYDQCKSITIEGRVESVQWKDPHSVVVLALDDGTAYTVDWNPVNALTRDGVIGPAQAAVVSGARISVTGNPIRSLAQIREHFPDYSYQVNPNTVDPTLIRRVGDSWSWAARRTQAPPDCGRK